MEQTLSSTQCSALLDILSHYDTYSEIRDFRRPGSLDHYGPPFTAEEKRPSTSPALQVLISRFALTLPGLKDVGDEGWKVEIKELIEALEIANLSESYDKGVIGSRKTLSTAISALIEYPVRGTYGGFAKISDSNRQYDLNNAKELSRAFRDFMDECIYGNVLEDLTKKVAETDKLEEHNSLTKAVHEFVLVNLASLMHYTLILSPKGQYLLKLVDNANKLVPYIVIRQTLRIGNVASMLNAMMKVVLAKMSVSSLTNWIGLTAYDDEGMNLMQHIISTVLSWDIRDLESRALKIEKEKSGPSKDQLQALKEYTTKTREEQEEIRKQSQQSSLSIVLAILAHASKPSDMSDATHKLALDYVNIELSIRDRKEIIRVLCHSQPDHLTNLVRNVVNAYEPVIRHMHNAIDLSDTVADFQNFLTDLLKVARLQPPGKDGKTVVPTVGDFVQLLKKHQYSVHKFMHQCCKNGKELTGWYLEWAQHAASQFKREDVSSALPNTPDAGILTKSLHDLFEKLPEDQQKRVIDVLDQQSTYLDEMHAASVARLDSVLKTPPAKPSHSTLAKYLTGTLSRPSSRPSSRASSPAPTPSKTGAAQARSNDGDDAAIPPPSVSSDAGPGAYLARWQDLLDNTPITPLTPHGKVAKASDKEVLQGSATDVDGEQMVKLESKGVDGVIDMQKVNPEKDDHLPKKQREKAKKPNVRIVVEAMADDFRALLGEQSLYW